MSIINAFPTTLANGTPEDAVQVMTLLNWILTQVNGGACPATTGSSVLKGNGAGGTTAATVDDLPGVNALAASGVVGLYGQNGIGVGTVRLELKVDQVIVKGASGSAFNQGAISTDFCDISTAGPITRGRDQVAAFAAGATVNFFYVYNPGAGTGGITASLNAPTTGPNLTGALAVFTKWAYATTVVLDGAAQLPNVRIRGRTVWREIDEAGSALAAGVATGYTAVNLAAWVPATALMVTLECLLIANHSVANTQFTGQIRLTGGLTSSNSQLAGSVISQVSGQAMQQVTYLTMPVVASQQIDYKLSAVPNNGGGLYLDVHSYTVANGDS